MPLRIGTRRSALALAQAQVVARQLTALGSNPELVEVTTQGDRSAAAITEMGGTVVVAYAGLSRLGRLDAVTEILDVDRMLPAPGQGALAVECRADNSAVVELLAQLDDATTRAAVTAERAVLSMLRAGCTAPVGAYAVASSGPATPPGLTVDAVVAGLTGAVI